MSFKKTCLQQVPDSVIMYLKRNFSAPPHQKTLLPLWYKLNLHVCIFFCTISLSSAAEWYGVIFVRSGVYQEGIFRFKIIIPENYPDGDCPVSARVCYINLLFVFYPLKCTIQEFQEKEG